MKTQKFPQRPAEPAGRRPEAASRELPTTEAHWDELHGLGNGNTRRFLSRVRNGIARRPWTDIAVAAAAGFAAGWLLSSQRRQHAVRELVMGSLLPAASRGVHHAYEAVRSNDTLRDLGHRVAKVKSRW